MAMGQGKLDTTIDNLRASVNINVIRERERYGWYVCS